MSDALIGVIIGGTFGFLGAITGIIANTYLDHKHAGASACVKFACAWLAIRSRLLKCWTIYGLLAVACGRASGWSKLPI